MLNMYEIWNADLELFRYVHKFFSSPDSVNLEKINMKNKKLLKIETFIFICVKFVEDTLDQWQVWKKRVLLGEYS